MSAPLRLALFAALLLAVGGGAAAVGAAVGPDPAPAERAAAPHGGAAGHAEAPHATGTGRTSAPAPAHTPATGAPAGLAAASDGLRLVLDEPVVRRAARAPLRLRVTDGAGRDVRDLEVAHTKRLHLILVRRDLTGFQHLHPRQAADGSWSATADLSRGGTWRVLADVTRAGEQVVLGADLQVAGDFRPAVLPAPAATATSDRGLPVRLRRDGDRVGFDVDAELQPYLGAAGHLVALREGDLAYAHTHPEGDALGFRTELPGPGTYRLWVQFQVGGEVHTAAFTEEVPS